MTENNVAGIAPARLARSWASLALVVAPFLVLMILGAMLPTIEFDALEYHLQGPKEYFLAGRIAFLPHNVYTSMPHGVEMLHLLGMEVLDDWWRGALVGQVLVMLHAPAAAALVAVTARRLASPRAAWVAAVAYLTAPWITRLAVTPFVEGPLCLVSRGADLGRGPGVGRSARSGKVPGESGQMDRGFQIAGGGFPIRPTRGSRDLGPVLLGSVRSFAPPPPLAPGRPAGRRGDGDASTRR